MWGEIFIDKMCQHRPATVGACSEDSRDRHRLDASTRGKAVKGEAEPDGAIVLWLRRLYGSREGLQPQLHTWSRCCLERLAGLRPDPLVEPLMEPCQPDPKCCLLMDILLLFFAWVWSENYFCCCACKEHKHRRTFRVFSINEPCPFHEI
jgi:hypothetical protein